MSAAPSRRSLPASPDVADDRRSRWGGLGAPRRDSTSTRAVAALRLHPHPVASALIALYAGVLVPTWRSGANLQGEPVVTFAITATALAAMVLVARDRWLVRSGVALAAAGAVHQQGEGEVLAAWTLLALVSVAWAVFDRPPLPLRRRVAPGAGVLVGLLSFVAYNGFSPQHSWQPLAVLAIAPASLLVSAGRRPAVGRSLEVAARSLEQAAMKLLTLPVAIVALVVRTLARALYQERIPGWTVIDEQLADPRRARRRERGRLRPAWRVVVATGTIGIVAVLVVRLGVLVLTGDGPSSRSVEANSAERLGVVQPGAPIPAAYTDERWYPGFRSDMAWVTDERVAWRPLTVQRVLDVETPTVNVRDRVRDSWSAPACSCERLTVWLYGGSGAFGLGQRDDHTIASEIARLAAADGVILDVQNRGIPGQMHWRNATRFSWDLTVEPEPDLVLFYEGAEEIDSELALRARGLADVRAPFEAFATTIYDEVVDAPPGDPLTPAGVTYDGWPTLAGDPGPPGQLAARRYDRSRSMSAWTAQAAGVPVRYYWQPSRFGGAQGPAIAEDDLRGRAFRNAPAMLADEVVDLSDALDHIDEPLFSDDVNHNEVAARLIAEAMWGDLRLWVEELDAS